MIATMPGINSNYLFWRGLVAKPSAKLLLFSRNEPLIDEVLRTCASSMVVYTGEATPPAKLGSRVCQLSALDELNVSDRETLVVDNLTAGQWRVIGPFLDRLCDDGQSFEIVISGRNRLSNLLRARRDPLAIRVSAIASRLEGLLKRPVRTFYSRWPIEPDGYDEIDITAGSDSHRAFYVPGHRLKTWRAFALSLPLVNAILPGWVLTSCQAGETWIEKAFTRLASERGIDAGKPRTSRYVTNEATAVAILRASSGRAAHVVRAPGNEKGSRLCSHNADVLQRIAGFGFSFRTPEFIGHENSAGVIYAETMIRGKELSLVAPAPVWLTRRVFVIDDEISHASRETLAWTALVEQCIERYKRGFDSAYHSRFDRLSTLLGACLRNHERIQTVASHGDFKLNNILFQPDLSISGVIDWDCFEERGLPLFDELTYLVFLYSAIDQQHHLIHYLDRILAPVGTDPHMRLVEERAESFGFDDIEYFALRILFWFDHALRRYRPADLAVDDRRRCAIKEPLDHVIDQLQCIASGTFGRG